MPGMDSSNSAVLNMGRNRRSAPLTEPSLAALAWPTKSVPRPKTMISSVAGPDCAAAIDDAVMAPIKAARGNFFMLKVMCTALYSPGEHFGARDLPHV